MAAAIRRSTKDDDAAAIGLLGPDAAGQVRGAHQRMLRANLNVALLEATSLKQKGLILRALGIFKSEDGISVQDEFEDLYDRFRNSVMHMSPFVADTIEGLHEFAVALDRARRRTREALAAS